MAVNPTQHEHGIAVNLKSLLWLAIPAMISTLLNNAYRIIDQYAVQWIGTDAQAAVGSSAFVLIAAYAIFLVISGGAAPLIARATGAGDPEKRRKIIGQSLIACGLASLLFCLFLCLGNEWITQAVGLEGSAAEQMETYLLWLGGTGFFLSFGPLIDAIYISMGNTKFPMALQLISTLLNAILNWLLIYELKMGIAGAAVASGISRGLVSIIGLIAIYRDFSPKHQFDMEIKRVLRIGLPVAMGTLMYALVYWALLKTSISPLGPEVNAALGIGFSALEGVSWPLYAGIMIAVSSLIGRQIGAQKLEECDKTIRLAFGFSTVLGGTISLTFYFMAEPLCSVFTSDPETLKEAIIYAKILAFSQLFVAWEALTEGILSGAGDTKTVFYWSVPFNLLRIPLSWILAFPLGWKAAGVWWAINMTTYAKAILKGVMVHRGKWKELEA